jgi:hypothetical protein
MSDFFMTPIGPIPGSVVPPKLLKKRRPQANIPPGRISPNPFIDLFTYPNMLYPSLGRIVKGNWEGGFAPGIFGSPTYDLGSHAAQEREAQRALDRAETRQGLLRSIKSRGI